MLHEIDLAIKPAGKFASWARTPHYHLRTAAFLNALTKVAVSYQGMGIFP